MMLYYKSVLLLLIYYIIYIKKEGEWKKLLPTHNVLLQALILSDQHSRTPSYSIFYELQMDEETRMIKSYLALTLF